MLLKIGEKKRSGCQVILLIHSLSRYFVSTMDAKFCAHSWGKQDKKTQTYPQGAVVKGRGR